MTSFSRFRSTFDGRGRNGRFRVRDPDGHRMRAARDRSECPKNSGPVDGAARRNGQGMDRTTATPPVFAATKDRRSRSLRLNSAGPPASTRDDTAVQRESCGPRRGNVISFLAACGNVRTQVVGELLVILPGSHGSEKREIDGELLSLGTLPMYSSPINAAARSPHLRASY